MKINVNGSSLEVKEGGTVADVLHGQPYQAGCFVALIRSTEQVKKATNEFEVRTNHGSFVIHVPDGPWLPIWRDLFPTIKDKVVRWQTSKVTAIGAFPSNIAPSRDASKFTRYDCLFALGGYDNRTTYIMISRSDHEASYGVASPIFGRITRGRHVLDAMNETDRILDIVPVIMEFRSSDAFATTDLGTVLEEGMSVETYISVKLDPRSPVSVEHFLVAVGNGIIKITDKTESFTACSTRMDVNLVEETHGIREEDAVTIRHTGPGMGRIYFYQRRRQTNVAHNIVGRIINGHQLVHLVPANGSIVVQPDPARVMVVGMTQKQAGEVLGSRGLQQNRTGEADDDAIVVEQEPELTVHALEDKAIDTFGARPERITYWYMLRDRSPNTVRYVEKMTGIDHKPIGTLKVHFTFEGMSMVTFEGDDSLGAKLFPELTFGETCRRCDVGVTNMARPNRGIIGIRLQDSPEFGPTGEEQHGTNLVGRFIGDLDAMMAGLKDGDIIYVRESREDPDRSSKPVRKPKAAAKSKAPSEAKGKSSAARPTRAKKTKEAAQ